MKKKLLVLGMVIALVVSMLCGCKIKNYNATLIDINNGEDKITLGYANFVFKYNQARYDIEYGEQYGMSMWTEDLRGSGQVFADEVKQNVVDTIEEQYAIKKHAPEYGVTLTDEDNKKIDEVTSQFMSDNSSSALDEMGADETVVKEFLTNLTYVAKMQQAVTKKGTEEGAINETTDSSTYINNLVNSWKSAIEFKVDDDLLAQLSVDELFKSPNSSNNSTKKTNTSSTSNSSNSTK